MPDEAAAAPLTDAEGAQLLSGLAGSLLALAVSGGADSMALMHLVARWARRDDVQAAHRERWRNVVEKSEASARSQSLSRPLKERPHWLAGIDTLEQLNLAGGPPHVVVLTVDHGLRPESGDEARFVVASAAELGLPARILVWQSPKPGSGLQAAARAARRDLLANAISREARIIATLALGRVPGRAERLDNVQRTLVMAHHQEDQAETVLMRLARGSGVEGLGGMRPTDRLMPAARQHCPNPSPIELHRPLLDVPKARLVATLRAANAAWIDDPSNDDVRFERVRFRRALATLGDLGLSPAKIALSARRLREADEAIHHLWRIQDPAQAVEDRIGPAWADILLDEPRFVAPLVLARTLRWLLAIYCGNTAPAELAQVEQLQLVCADATRRSATSGLTLAGCKLEFHGEAGQLLRIYREAGIEGLAVTPIEPGQSVNWDGGRFAVTAPSDLSAGAVVRPLGLAGWAAVKRELPALAAIRLPSAAMATLPVVVVGDRIISMCGVDLALRTLQPALPLAAAQAWDAAWGRAESSVVTRFRGGEMPRW